MSRREVALGDVQVRPAHAARADAHENFAGRRHRRRFLRQAQRIGFDRRGPFERDRAHEQSLRRPRARRRRIGLKAYGAKKRCSIFWLQLPEPRGRAGRSPASRGRASAGGRRRDGRRPHRACRRRRAPDPRSALRRSCRRAASGKSPRPCWIERLLELAHYVDRRARAASPDAATRAVRNTAPRAATAAAAPSAAIGSSRRSRPGPSSTRPSRAAWRTESRP